MVSDLFPTKDLAGDFYTAERYLRVVQCAQFIISQFKLNEVFICKRDIIRYIVFFAVDFFPNRYLC